MQNMHEYLETSDYIDWDEPAVLNKAQEIAAAANGELDVAKRCFEFVRDEIKHSSDYRLNPVTLKASEVLKYGTGVCYAKSHLLAALLRANSIPAALCYQRLSVGDGGFCLHGLNAVWLQEHGWYRVDARGNKEGVEAEFIPPMEKLAFLPELDGEIEASTRYAQPIETVLQSLRNASSIEELERILPDQPSV